jgi:hypothetical protein
MIPDRIAVARFLKKQKSASKEEVLANFASWAIVQGTPVDKVGKLISDIRSYPEWTWGE